MAEARKLDEKFVKSVSPTHRHEEYPDTMVLGLRLYVSKSGSKSYGFRKNPYGYVALGSVTEIGLPKARKIAADIRTKFAAGGNPIQDMKVAKGLSRDAATSTSPTLVDAWQQYKDRVLPSKSASHQRNMAGSMERHYLPKFGKRTPGDVTRREHVAFRELHEAQRPAEMRQMKAYISAFYKWMAQTSDYMDLVEGPPNMGKVNAAQVVRTRKLTEPDDIRAYWRALSTLTPRAGALALQFKWLCNKRGIEVQRMTPDQIDFRRATWTLPDVENKAKNVVQPLTPKMQELIRDALGNRATGYVFSTTGGDNFVTLGSKLAKAAVAAAGTGHISFHDYRRTFSTQLEEMGVPSRVLKLTEGHYDKGIEAHYQQATKRPLDEQLEAYQKWEQFLGVGI